MFSTPFERSKYLGPKYIGEAIAKVDNRIQELNTIHERDKNKLLYRCFSADTNREKEMLLTTLKQNLESQLFVPLDNRDDLKLLGFEPPAIKTLYKGFFSHQTRDTLVEVIGDIKKGNDKNWYRFSEYVAKDILNIFLEHQLSENKDALIAEKLLKKIKQVEAKVAHGGRESAVQPFLVRFKEEFLANLEKMKNLPRSDANYITKYMHQLTTKLNVTKNNKDPVETFIEEIETKFKFIKIPRYGTYPPKNTHVLDPKDDYKWTTTPTSTDLRLNLNQITGGFFHGEEKTKHSSPVA
jgi:hypothetical protein